MGLVSADNEQERSAGVNMSVNIADSIPEWLQACTSLITTEKEIVSRMSAE
jgi:hypothetical protein